LDSDSVQDHGRNKWLITITGGIGKLVNDNGGEYATKVTDTCTHLIVSEKDAVSKSSEKGKFLSK